MLSKAIRTATDALAGKVDANGNPYIDHANRVMDRMNTQEEKMVAILHDVVEDTEMSLTDLLAQGFPREVVEAVGILTKRKDMTYFEYIDDIRCNELATKVKIAEIEDNLDLPRVQKMSFQTYSPQVRAKKAIAILKGEEGGSKSN
ncbi:MAG: GTP pyrophosphokinase [Clostridiales bacterium]|nr:GTP pyrophosphokinase [Clostridiales bacterium]MCD8369332.1 GTP pyrophosphokinase [Clostridiales bacterium]